MPEMAGDPAALVRLREQRGRLADRLRPPGWYVTGIAVAWAVAFTGPFTLRYLPRPDYWAIGAGQLVLWILLQQGLARATGMKVGPRPRRVLRAWGENGSSGRAMLGDPNKGCSAGASRPGAPFSRRLRPGRPFLRRPRGGPCARPPRRPRRIRPRR